MFDKESLEYLQSMEQRMAALMSGVKDDLREEIGAVKKDVDHLCTEVSKVNLVLENEIRPQLKALAEGQQMILQNLTPKTEVEKLREEVDLLRTVLRMHTLDIEELKKAQ